MRSVSELTDLIRADDEFTEVARLWATDALGNQDADLAEIVAALVDEEHVPFLPVYRYKPAGLRRRADWEHVWNLQRQDDAIAAEPGKDVTDPAVCNAVKEKLGDIPMPPKYGSGDFLRISYWRHRGKLDVPKEQFISYPPRPATAMAARVCRLGPPRGRVGRRTAAAATRWSRRGAAAGRAVARRDRPGLRCVALCDLRRLPRRPVGLSARSP